MKEASFQETKTNTTDSELDKIKLSSEPADSFILDLNLDNNLEGKKEVSTEENSFQEWKAQIEKEKRKKIKLNFFKLKKKVFSSNWHKKRKFKIIDKEKGLVFVFEIKIQELN